MKALQHESPDETEQVLKKRSRGKPVLLEEMNWPKVAAVAPGCRWSFRSRPSSSTAGICPYLPTACCWAKSSAARPSHWATAWSGRRSYGWATRTIISTSPEPSRRRRALISTFSET